MVYVTWKLTIHALFTHDFYHVDSGEEQTNIVKLSLCSNLAHCHGNEPRHVLQVNSSDHVV